MVQISLCQVGRECVKKEQQTLVSTDCLISTNAQFTQSTLTIVVLLVMKCYLFPQVFLAFWIRVLPSLWPLMLTPLTEARQSYFQFKIKAGFSACPLTFEFEHHYVSLRRNRNAGLDWECWRSSIWQAAEVTHPPKCPSTNTMTLILMGCPLDVKPSTHSPCYSIHGSCMMYMTDDCQHTHTFPLFLFIWGNPQMQAAGRR